jgi:hypothetical protein
MKKIYLPVAVTAFCLLTSLIVRDDVTDDKFIELAKAYPQICHFPMGEGVLIDSSWVLTAGHLGRDLLMDMERGFSPTVKCNGQELAIAKVELHPHFEDTPDGIINDIALVQVKGIFPAVSPAKIYTGQDETGKKITLVGMGDMGTGLTGPLKWDKLTRAATNMVDASDSLWISFAFDPPSSPKATEMEGISGPGDSGGPAFIESGKDRFVAGISSHQLSKNGKGRYGAVEFYTRVSSYKDWITKVISPKSTVEQPKK